jgi:hypothetical protein
VREAAVARAKLEGVSLNVWVERTLGAALADGVGGEPRTAVELRARETKSAPRRAPATKAPAKPRVDWRQFS